VFFDRWRAREEEGETSESICSSSSFCFWRKEKERRSRQEARDEMEEKNRKKGKRGGDELE
jgi:hypothetical protein